MQLDRVLAKMTAKMTAKVVGAFWLPCPSCGREFGGHEWTDVNGHAASVPVGESLTRGNAICRDCTANGVGCRAWAERGVRRLDCGCDQTSDSPSPSEEQQ
jgi:hypothetical protein